MRPFNTFFHNYDFSQKWKLKTSEKGKKLTQSFGQSSTKAYYQSLKFEINDVHLNKLDYKCCTWLLNKIDVKLIESENLNVIIPCPSPWPGCKVAGWGAGLSWAGGGAGNHPSVGLTARHGHGKCKYIFVHFLSCLDMCLLSVYDHNKDFVLFCVLLMFKFYPA